MEEKQLLIAQLIKRNGHVVYVKKSDQKAWDDMVEALPEGGRIMQIIDPNGADGKVALIARIHQLIRLLSREIGENFSDIKLQVKKESGLIIKENVKSFGDCSQHELEAAVEAAIRIGEFIGINNLR